ncbi:hypothetical protein DFR86_05590 [Acidianus sulfidivorans JP7]|uniref:Uncharacterized protein n=1 Tax=Acidianus sulfidivorans JP7 TaxID=619593 RepID=A0A2U9IM30_9CREN|nr:hypothetical protein [Acidianus sulfidivorans]AWR97086.1 hypothetical protein DFR86_05590 [Acidianus sulfidivorans JP7]
MLSLLAKVKDKFSIDSINNIYDLELKILKDANIPTKNSILTIRKAMKINITLMKRKIDNLILISLTNLSIMFLSILYSILYKNPNIILTALITGIFSISYIYYIDIFKTERFHIGKKELVILIPFSIIFFPFSIPSLIFKTIIALAISQLLIIKFNLIKDNYYEELEKSKQLLNKELKSIILYKTAIAEKLARLNSYYNRKITEIRDKTKLLNLANLLLPLTIYPLFKFINNYGILLLFVSSILVSMILTKTTRLALLQPKIIIYYCSIAAIFSLL